MKKIAEVKQILSEGKGFSEVVRRGFRYIIRICSFPIGLYKIVNKNTYGSKKVLDFLFSNSGYIIFTMQKKDELRRMLELVEKEKPINILEIGTANGGTLFSLCRTSPKNARIISLDLPGGKFGGGYAKWRKHLYNLFKIGRQKLYLIRGDSHSKKMHQKIKSILGGSKLDFLFIDGDHTYAGVKKDFEMYSQLVKNGGTIVLHDINITSNESKVYEFWNEIKKKYPFKEFIYQKKIGWAGIGLTKFTRKRPNESSHRSLRSLRSKLRGISPN